MPVTCPLPSHVVTVDCPEIGLPLAHIQPVTSARLVIWVLGRGEDSSLSLAKRNESMECVWRGNAHLARQITPLAIYMHSNNIRVLHEKGWLE